eukprot:TRINITY_DN5451_c0_g1_i4.p1 TRINITY_DN5451_c0_g1~~TRINITY_DN5451_c0_g1_i4.p1  ORF type:complete len:150 (-),score=27.63 TRINITY_DN5451_c0_g1_i4:550-999(-)
MMEVVRIRFGPLWLFLLIVQVLGASLLENKWNPETTLDTALSRCTIETVETLGVKKFYEEYYEKKPVVIKSYSTGVSQFWVLCNKRQLIETYGSVDIVLSSANSYSYTRRVSTLRNYVEKVGQNINSEKNGLSSYISDDGSTGSLYSRR